MLFDEIDRSYTGPQANSENDFAFLNRSAIPEAEAVRQLLEFWLSKYPNEDRAELISRLRGRNTEHRAAFFELYLHELFSNLGCEVVVHPELPGTSRRPDFGLDQEHLSRSIVEATLVTGQSKEDEAASARENAVYDALQSHVSSRDFLLHLDLVGHPATPPSGKRLAKFLNDRIKGLDWIAVDQAMRTEGLQGLPQWEYSADGWEIIFRVFPKPASQRGQPGIRPVASKMHEVVWPGPEGILTSLRGKAGGYGIPGQPFIVAVNILGLQFDREALVEALFGTEGFASAQDADGFASSPVLTRNADGLWGCETKPRYTRVSAVLATERLHSSNVDRTQATLFLNPWAACPCSGYLLQLPTVSWSAQGLVAEPGREVVDMRMTRGSTGS